MMLALIFACSLSLTLALLWSRQVQLTRRAREDAEAWKHLYEQVHSDRVGLLETLRALEGKGDPTASRPEAQRKSPDRIDPQPKTNQPLAVSVSESGRQAPKAAGSLTLVLPIQLLSKNTRDKLHFQARGKLRKEYLEIIELKYPRRAPAPQVRQRATVTRIKGPRERDWDEQNIGAGTAIELIDAMTRAGFWHDDSPRWLQTDFRQGSREKIKGPAVVIEINTRL